MGGLWSCVGIPIIRDGPQSLWLFLCCLAGGLGDTVTGFRAFGLRAETSPDTTALGWQQIPESRLPIKGSMIWPLYPMEVVD